MPRSWLIPQFHGPLPQGRVLFEFELRHPMRRRVRQRFGMGEKPRPLAGARLFAPVGDFLGDQHLPRPRHRHHQDFIFAQFTGHGNRRGLEHLGMRRDHLIDFRAGDILAAPADDILLRVTK